jgi:hypothetical protein
MDDHEDNRNIARSQAPTSYAAGNSSLLRSEGVETVTVTEVERYGGALTDRNKQCDTIPLFPRMIQRG